MKNVIMQFQISPTHPDKVSLAEALTKGTKVRAPNEDPVRVDLIELDPYVKVIKPSRSSTIYDKIE